MEVPGVLDASVGYTGREFNELGDTAGPMNNADEFSPQQQQLTRYCQPVATYESVCGGDGHTEAVRVVFDPSVVSYEDIVRLFFENPRVPSVYGEQELQYQVACWAMDDRQLAAAKRASEAAGKGGVPIYDARRTMWHEGEDNHQNFFGSKPNRGPDILSL